MADPERVTKFLEPSKTLHENGQKSSFHWVVLTQNLVKILSRFATGKQVMYSINYNKLNQVKDIKISNIRIHNFVYSKFLGRNIPDLGLYQQHFEV